MTFIALIFAIKNSYSLIAVKTVAKTAVCGYNVVSRKILYIF